MITIGKATIRNVESFSILENTISINNTARNLWFKVDLKYEPYLCHEVGDAYLVAILNYAMVNQHDIVSLIPISETLLYNINTFLIPALCENNATYHFPKIICDIFHGKLKNAGAVGTGISCGVDSLHAIASNNSVEYSNHRITHVALNNVGSFGIGEKAHKLYNQRIDNPRTFAEENNFQFVLSDSNLMDVIEQNHFKTHTYSSMFPVLCLQKLYSIYFYASAGYKFNEFNLKDTEKTCCGSYELLSLNTFSTDNCRIISDGMGKSRLSKLRTVSQYRPSYNHLNVCLKEGNNCGKCEKCVRTLLGIDAIGKLEEYKDVFDIEYYRSHKKWYLQLLLYRIIDKKHDYFELYPYFKKEITLLMRLKTIKYRIYNIVKKILSNYPALEYHIRRIIHKELTHGIE